MQFFFFSVRVRADVFTLNGGQTPRGFAGFRPAEPSRRDRPRRHVPTARTGSDLRAVVINAHLHMLAVSSPSSSSAMTTIDALGGVRYCYCSAGRNRLQTMRTNRLVPIAENGPSLF